MFYASWTPTEVTNLVMQVTALVAGLTALVKTLRQDGKHVETRKDIEANREQIRDVKEAVRTNDSDIKKVMLATTPPTAVPPVVPVRLPEIIEEGRDK